ncbi:MAG: trypsin-like peptidase domain-containing protein [Sediminibacterium sp.]|nr:trypsin-like peptidase domain-containing protein [Sediminibacterium sp.]
MKSFLKLVLVILVVSIVSATSTFYLLRNYTTNKTTFIDVNGKLPVNYAGYFGEDNNGKPLTDFTVPAETATPAVVHIQTKTKARIVNSQPRQKRFNPFGDQFGDDFFDDFFGGPQRIPEQQASGSGVIIKNDGYIVTNNHVVKDADEIKVTLTNNKSYKATVVGTDASTDLAVLKIDEDNLPILLFGNSDNAKLGQWVLAIGYPLNLDVTVTAGIISAKNRNIGINQQGNPNGTAIETFIQTDAPVNRGNSGGALVNIKGELVGINSAIVSPSGTFAGYSYAIPSNLVKKVVNDIVKYGLVQRAFLGISALTDLNKIPEEEKAKFKKETGIDVDKAPEGIIIADILEGGASEKAGMKKGDIITKINDVSLKSMPELQEQIARYKPGDVVKVTYIRDGASKTVTVTLKNKLKNESIEKYTSLIDKLGGTLVTIDKKTADKYNVPGGILVKERGTGLIGKSKIENNFVIITVNDIEVPEIDDFKSVIQKFKDEKKVDVIGFYLGDGALYKIPLYLNSDKK